MYRNLTKHGTSDSVHLTDYPIADATLIDSRLSDDMEALLRLVSLGSAARDAVKIKRRQPLAELRIQPATDADRRAVERFAEQVKEELNVKKVSLHDPAAAPLLSPTVKANMKSLGPKCGPRLQEVKAALETTPASVLEEKGKAGAEFELNCPGGPFVITAADFTINYVAPEGWAGVADRGTQVALDTRITEA